MKKGKKYLEASKLVEKNKLYTKEEAIKLVKETNVANFDASVEIALRLNLDTKKADQQLRGATVLPNGTGKTKKVLVIAKGDQAKAAKEAGADFVGDVDMVLGPKGLMPNPKTGTVTMDVKKAVEDVKKGRVEYRTDSFGNIHAIIGKVSFDDAKLIENLDAFVSLMIKIKPSVVKGKYIKNISIASTMGPGIKIDTTSFDN